MSSILLIVAIGYLFYLTHLVLTILSARFRPIILSVHSSDKIPSTFIDLLQPEIHYLKEKGFELVGALEMIQSPLTSSPPSGEVVLLHSEQLLLLRFTWGL